MRKRFIQKSLASGLLILLPATALFVSCDGGGGGGASLSQAATIRGSVASFEGSQAFFVPEPRRGFWAGLWRAVCDLAAPPAYAGVGGVSVSVAGTDLKTSTADDGLFVVSGVPPGTREVIFSLGADSGSLQVEVPPNSTVNLRNVHVRGGAAEAERVEVEEHEDPSGGEDGSKSESESSGDNGGDNGGDDGEDG